MCHYNTTGKTQKRQSAVKVLNIKKSAPRGDFLDLEILRHRKFYFRSGALPRSFFEF